MDIVIYCDFTHVLPIPFFVTNLESIEDFPSKIDEALQSMTKSYYEDRIGFEDLITQTAKESILVINSEQVESQEERRSIVLEKLKEIFGEIEIAYEIDLECYEGDMGVDDSVFAEPLYNLLIADVLAEINRISEKSSRA